MKRKQSNQVRQNGITKPTASQRRKPVSPEQEKAWRRCMMSRLGSLVHNSGDGTAPLSPGKLKLSIGEPLVTDQCCAQGWNLTLIAATNDVQLFTDNDGSFYLDRIVSYDTTRFLRSSFGEYTVKRNRLRVTREFALATLLHDVVPPHFDDMMAPLYKAWGDIS